MWRSLFLSKVVIVSAAKAGAENTVTTRPWQLNFHPDFTHSWARMMSSTSLTLQKFSTASIPNFVPTPRFALKLSIACGCNPTSSSVGSLQRRSTATGSIFSLAKFMVAPSGLKGLFTASPLIPDILPNTSMYDQNLACNECLHGHHLKHTLNAVIEFTELVWIHNTISLARPLLPLQARIRDGPTRVRALVFEFSICKYSIGISILVHYVLAFTEPSSWLPRSKTICGLYLSLERTARQVPQDHASLDRRSHHK